MRAANAEFSRNDRRGSRLDSRGLVRAWQPSLTPTSSVYRFDPRFPEKQRIATELLREGIRQDSLRVPQQAVVEFVAAVTRPLPGSGSLLTPEDARRECDFNLRFPVVLPRGRLIRY